VWIAYANFELVSEDNGANVSDRVPKSRSIFERAEKVIKAKGNKDERVVLLEAWKEFEKSVGDESNLRKVVDKMPKAVKKRRRVEGDEGAWEEYYDYLFPDDISERPNLKLFQMAHQWKEKMKAGVLDDSDSDEESDSEEEEEDEEEEDSEVQVPDKGKGRAVDKDESEEEEEEGDDDVEPAIGSSSNSKKRRHDDD
jgi:crooked neck